VALASIRDKDRQELDLFSRVYNSLLPFEQIVRRIGRAASDPDIDLLSREGLLDETLLPLVGLLSSRERDVRDEEWVGIMAPGADKENIATQIGLSIATDPLTYLTLGATALGKAGKAANKLVQLSAFQKGGGSLLSSVDEATAIGKKMLADPTVGGSARRKVKGALDAFAKAPATKGEGNLLSLSDKAKDTKLAIAVPFIHRWGILSWSPKWSQGYKSWFQVGTSKGGDAIAWAGAVGAKVPLLGKPIGAVSRFLSDAVVGAKSGVKVAGRSLHKMALDNAREAGDFDPVLNVLTDNAHSVRKSLKGIDRTPDQVGARFDELMGSPESVRAEIKGVIGDSDDAVLKRLAESKYSPFIFNGITDPMENVATLRANLRKRRDELRKGATPDVTKRRSWANALLGTGPYGTLEEIRAELKLLGKLTAQGKGVSKKRSALIRKLARAQTRTAGKNLLESIGISTRKLDGEEIDELSGRYWRTIEGGSEAGAMPVRGSELSAGVDRFNIRITEAVDNLTSGSIEVAETAAHKLTIDAMENGAVKRAFFKFFRKAESLRVKGFDSAIGSKELVKEEQELWARVATGTEALRANYVRLLALVPQAAEEMGVDPEIFREVLRNVLESATFEEEAIAIVARGVGGESADVVKLHHTIEQWVTRSESASDALGIVLREKGGVRAAQAGDELIDLAGEGLKDKDLQVIFDEANNLPARQFETQDEIIMGRGSVGAHKIKWGPQSGQRLIYLTDEELKNQIKVSRAAKKKGSAHEAKLAEEVLRARSTGLAKRIVPSRTKRTNLLGPEHRRDPEDIVGTAGETAELGELALLRARILSKSADLQEQARRGIEAGLSWSNEKSIVDISELRGLMMQASHAVEEIALAGMGDTGRIVFREARRIQREILQAGIEAGTIRASSPLAYLPRVFDVDKSKAIRTILRNVPDEVLNNVSPTFASTVRRHQDALTLDELEQFSAGLRRIDPERAKKIDALLEAEGITQRRYTADPLEALFTRWAQAVKSDTTAEFIGNVLRKGVSEEGLRPVVGGQVVGVITETGREVYNVPVKKLKAEAGEGPTTISTQIAEEIDDVRGLIIRDQETGKDIFLNTQDLHDDYQMMVLGTGDSVEHAFANAQGSGTLLDNVFKSGGDVTADRVLAMQGRRVMVGNPSGTVGLAAALEKQADMGPQWIRSYDKIHGVLRKMQTVYRLPFHIANLSSSVFQSMASGVSAGDALGGAMDAARLLARQEEFIHRYDRTVRLMGRGQGIKMLASMRRAGAKGTGGEKVMIQLGDREIEMRSLLNMMVERNLFSSFVSEALRGSNSVTGGLAELKEIAEQGGTFWERSIRGVKQLDQRAAAIAESSEVFARISGVMGALRSGFSPQDAIEMTKRAMVDYSRVTPFERTWLKRAFSYYTFPRHYIPFAWKRFAEDPAAASRLMHGVRGGLGNGLLVNEGGNVELKFDDWRLNVQRMDANLDALMALPAIADFLLYDPTEISGEVRGTPSLPAFLQFGTLAQPIMNKFDGDKEIGEQGFVGDMLDTVPAWRFGLRLLGEKGNPEIDYTPLENSLDAIFPVRKVRERHEQRLLVARYKEVERVLTSRIKEAVLREDEDAVTELQEEAQEAGLNLSTALERLGE